MPKIRNFHERHSTIGEWQGSIRVLAGSWQGNGMVCVNRPLRRQGNGMVCVNRRLKADSHIP
jgi:hypothetical protein